MNINLSIRFALVLFAFAGLCASGQAADKKAAVTLRNAMGTVDAISRDKVEVTLKTYGKVSISASAKTTIRVKGDFGLDKIQPGMYLTVSGTIDGTTIPEEIKEATMFSLADGFKPGIVKITDSGPQSISGKVEKIDGQTVTLNTGRKITATLSKDVKVSLDSGDMSLVGPGCDVEVRGSLTDKEVKASYVTFWVAKNTSTAARNVVKANADDAKAAAATAKPAPEAKPDAATPKPDAEAKPAAKAKPEADAKPEPEAKAAAKAEAAAK